jgi:hypothetical protein
MCCSRPANPRATPHCTTGSRTWRTGVQTCPTEPCSRPRSGCGYDQAKASLFDAFERGIPYYSAGVAWLLDGLTLFAGEDPEAEERMKLVHKVAQRLDVSQAFTVIRLSDKARRK